MVASTVHRIATRMDALMLGRGKDGMARVLVSFLTPPPFPLDIFDISLILHGLCRILSSMWRCYITNTVFMYQGMSSPSDQVWQVLVPPRPTPLTPPPLDVLEVSAGDAAVCDSNLFAHKAIHRFGV